MEIRGPNLGRYDPGHIGAVQREIPRSVKPNVLRELDDQVAQALLLTTTDLVKLSPEAQAYLRELRRRLRDGKRREDPLQGDEQDFESLLHGLEEFRREAEEGQTRVGTPAASRPAFPPTITLSHHAPQGARPTPSGGGRGASRLRELLDGMIHHAPSQEVKELVKRELEVMGEQLVSQVKQFGVRIIVLPRAQALTELRLRGMAVVGAGERTFDGRPWETVRGLYDPSRRLLVVGEEVVGSPFRSVARHELAHAFDHAFSEKNRRKLPLSVQLWNLFRGERTGLVSDYAGTNPAEYFAESVEAFFQEGSRPQLQAQDPRMFQYLAELFGAR